MQSKTACAAAHSGIASGKYQGEPRGEGHSGVAASHQLVAIVEENIADADAGIRKVTRVHGGQAVAELVARISRYGPFLGECVIPVLAVPETSEARNVLDYSEILIVSLLNQEAVVLYISRSGRGRTVLAKGICTNQDNSGKNETTGLKSPTRATLFINHD